jgi:uncharacterized LabA/DUF88 family protein
MSPTTNKIALFIDGANLYATAKTLGFDIDYKRLLKEFQSRGTLLRAFYYTAVIEDQEFPSIRPLIDLLRRPKCAKPSRSAVSCRSRAINFAFAPFKFGWREPLPSS